MGDPDPLCGRQTARRIPPVLSQASVFLQLSPLRWSIGLSHERVTTSSTSLLDRLTDIYLTDSQILLCVSIGVVSGPG